MEKKKENYKYAKRIGLLVIIVGAVLSTLSSIATTTAGLETTASNSITFSYWYIVPFIVEAFYPYPDEWGIVRKAWSCFCHGLLRLLGYLIITLATAFGMFFLYSWKIVH